MRSHCRHKRALIICESTYCTYNIGIGEVVRIVVGKAIMKTCTARQDLMDAIGSLQLCAGQDAGCEASVHAMTRVFDEKDTEAMIFVDASNATQQTS